MTNWNELIKAQQCEPYYKVLTEFLQREYSTHTIYPPIDKQLVALELTPFESVRVVIIGQDPYHQPNQANGLAFSVNTGIKLPPSLKNIYKMFGCEDDTNGDLTYLAKQGVLLLNTVLTVRDSEPNSHKNKGWEQFTDSIISALSGATTPVVFMLWGNNAIEKKSLITNKLHLVLTAPHPSPLSAHRGFLTCNHQTMANDFLIAHNLPNINWKRLL